MAAVYAALCATGSADRCAPSLPVTVFNAVKAAGTMWLRLPAPAKTCRLMAIPCNGSLRRQRPNADFAAAVGVIYFGDGWAPTAPRFGLVRLMGQAVCTLRSKCLSAPKAITTTCRMHRRYLTDCDYFSTYQPDCVATRSVTTTQKCSMPSEVQQGK